MRVFVEDAEALLGDGRGVVAQGDGGKEELAALVGFGGLRELGAGGADGYLCSLDGAVLGIVNDALHAAKDGREGSGT